MATTKKKQPKKTGKVKNGHNKNNRTIVEEAETLKVFPAVQPQEAHPSMLDVHHEIGFEVGQFRDQMVAKYGDYHGRDLRAKVAWYMEQCGLKILSDMEREKYKKRQEIIAENLAKEAAEQAAEK